MKKFKDILLDIVLFTLILIGLAGSCAFMAGIMYGISLICQITFHPIISVTISCFLLILTLLFVSACKLPINEYIDSLAKAQNEEKK